jgi:hypothetical protein
VFIKTHTVLLIHEDLNRLHIWSAEARRHGFQVVCATCSAEAIKAYGPHISAVALALTGKDDGRDFLLAVEDTHEVPILACADNKNDRLKQMTYGCADMVTSFDWVVRHTAIAALMHEATKWRRKEVRDLVERDHHLPRPATPMHA